MRINFRGLKNADGKELISLECTHEELEILKSVIDKSISYTPKVISTQILLGRMQSISRGIRHCLLLLRKQTPVTWKE